MKKGDYLKTILRSKKTVFSFKDIVLLWRESNLKAARVRINYYIKNGDLYHLRRGFYAKDKNYNKYELAAKIYTPSYISLETVLAKAGLIFQFYSQIFVISYLTREIKEDGQIYLFRKIKDNILTNSLGVENKDNYSIATTERAFLDILYLNSDYYFDNLSELNWDKVFKIISIYKNKRMEKKVKKHYQEFKNN